MSNPQQLVQKLWNYCNILRDDGLSYGDLASQARHYLVPQITTCASRTVVVELTFLLFLKMADEQARPPFKKLPFTTKGCSPG